MLAELLNTSFMGRATWLWVAFACTITALLAFDLGVLHKDDRAIGLREALLLSSAYIAVALLFGAGIWWQLGTHSGTAYFTGFLIEKLLSIDNIYVMTLIFAALSIPVQYQHGVLFLGILGAFIVRALMIGAGAALISEFSWILYFFGAFLIFTGATLWFSRNRTPDIATNPVLTFLRKRLKAADVKGNAFLVRRPDPVSGRYLKFALALVLIFIGAKVFLGAFIVEIPPIVSMSVTLGLIGGSVLASIWKGRREPTAMGQS